jgi:hypothetical protein
VRHGGGGSRTGDGDRGYNAGKLCRFNEIHALGEGGGEASVEGVAGTGGFDNGAGVDGGDVADEGVVFDEGSLGTKGEDDVADASGEEGCCCLFGGGEVGDGDAGEGGGFGLVGGEVITERIDGVGQRGGWSWVEDGGNVVGMCDSPGRVRRWGVGVQAARRRCQRRR